MEPGTVWDLVFKALVVQSLGFRVLGSSFRFWGADGFLLGRVGLGLTKMFRA